MKANKWNILFISIASIALILFIYITNDVESLKKIIFSANIKWLLIAILCMVIYWILETGVLYCTANSVKRKLSYFHAFKTTMVGQLFNCLTPFSSGGQPMQAYFLMKAKFEIGEATGILLMKFIVYQGAMVLYTGLLLVIKLTFFVDHVASVGYLAILGFTVNLVVIFGLMAIGFFPNLTLRISNGSIHLLAKFKIIKRKEYLLEKVDTQIHSFHKEFRTLLTQKTILAKSVGITFLQLTAYFLIPFCICMAFQVQNASIISIVAASAFVMMISAFVPLPGASGGAEGSFYLFFGIFLLNPSIIAVAVVVWRLITFYLPIFVGMFFCQFGHSTSASQN